MAEETLRIDKFLWFARLARTRAIARKIAEKGHIRLAGRRITHAHAIVRVGDTLSIPLPGEVRIIRIESLPARRVSAKDVPDIYSPLDSVANDNR